MDALHWVRRNGILSVRLKARLRPGLTGGIQVPMTLKEFFTDHSRAALAFSGGVDSALLLWAGMTWGRDIRAYYVKTCFQPEFELEDARKLARQLGARLEILPARVLDVEKIRENPADRCYHCKKIIFGQILEAAHADGYSLLLDGTNASDDASDRPGMRALRELQVRSPLRECGLTKSAVRELSRQAGLFTWNKPAYACLATRIPTGTALTAKLLQRTEKAEDYLASLGFRDFRVRTFENCAKLQLRQEDFPLLLQKKEEITKRLKQDYGSVLLDLEARHGQ